MGFECSRSSTIGQLYAEHGAAMRAQARALSRSPADAEDLFQAVWLRLTEYLASGLPVRGKTASAWLHTILKNFYRDQRRCQAAAWRSLEDPVVRDWEWAAPSTLQDLTAIDLVTEDQLEAAVRTLTRGQRDAYELVTRGKSYQEIAEALGIPKTAVAKRLHDARQKLRRELLRLVREQDRAARCPLVTESCVDLQATYPPAP